MLTLRLTQFTEAQDKYRAEVALEGDNMPRQTATVNFDFKLTAQDQEDLRWYLEDYLQYPLDPAPKIAARIEGRMAEIGAKLFKDVFRGNDYARDMWVKISERLNDIRVEIVAEVREATAIPWELIRDPKTETPLALRARAFVRSQPQSAQVPKLPETESGRIRILLVICRPGGDEDVPFRSVASRLIKGLSESAHEVFQLDVLRPATFERLSEILRKAKAEGKPYHVVHFDGHGVYTDTTQSSRLAELLKSLIPHLLSAPRSGAHGYLMFENPTLVENIQLVDGPALGKLLVETDVPVLVLNACRSAHAEAPAMPGTAGGDDPHKQVRALGSLAQEVMVEGVTGVVAMRYNVYVVTAAQFVVDLYASLTQGHTLGEAVTLGRKQLKAQPLREIAYNPLPLQDWFVPVVYEAAPIPVFPKPAKTEKLTVKLSDTEAMPERGTLDPKMPPRPDAGFFGRDETLLALDRAFDTQSIVLLHAYAGSGKTATAAEFARWYSLTGGIEGPVLFTSFEQYKPLPRVLDQIEQVFGKMLEGSGINWLALDDVKRRDVALQLLKQIPVLWIWDNVEPVAGFPAGTESAWSEEDQKELVDFIRTARDTRVKFLLTSRRDERELLGDLPSRIIVPPMPMQERVQFARALAEKHGQRLTDVEDWRPLLRFTQGNPLTITVLVGQALRDGLKTKDEIKDFVAKLRRGESAFEDQAKEGRAKSLGASLSYGFQHAFNEKERKQLALLHLFQGFVNVTSLRLMGNPKADYCLPEVRALTREAGLALLDRAAEVGILAALGEGCYTIQPAVPWYFKSLFDIYYPTTPDPESEIANAQLAATRAFVKAVSVVGSHYFSEYQKGHRDIIDLLAAEETNLLHARQLARANGFWHAVIETMQGLRTLHDHTGRRSEWERLVDGIVPDFVDPKTDGPLPGLDYEWALVNDYRVNLARGVRKWVEAERLQRIKLEWSRSRAPKCLAAPSETLASTQHAAIRSLAVALGDLGQILYEQDKPDCLPAYEESVTLLQRIGDRAAEGAVTFNLGNVYKDVTSLRDLAQTERWYQHSLALHEERDSLGRGRCLGALGQLAYQRFEEALTFQKTKGELARHLDDSAQFLYRAIAVFPPNAVNDLAVTHNELAGVYRSGGDLYRTLQHCREAIRYFEAAGNLHDAAFTRYNVALTLAGVGSFADARDYAYAALRNLEAFGEHAAEDIQRTRELIADIEKEMNADKK